jgi:HD superfamily phosphohydrolase
MSKIVLDEKEVNELMDTFDFQKSLYLQELQKLNTSSQKNVEDLKILILKFNEFNLNWKTLKEIETEINKISQASSNINVKDFEKNLKDIVDSAAKKLQIENNQLEIESNRIHEEVQNLKEQIPLIVSVGKENLVKEINITSRFLRFNTLLSTFLGGFFVGALLLFFYHILYMQKHNEYITFFLMGNAVSFAVFSLS